MARTPLQLNFPLRLRRPRHPRQAKQPEPNTKLQLTIRDTLQSTFDFSETTPDIVYQLNPRRKYLPKPKPKEQP